MKPAASRGNRYMCMRVVFLFCYQKPWKQISPMTNHIIWMFAKKQTRVKFTFLLSSFIVYSFTVPCCFLRNTVIIAWLKINANVNVNGMLINCVIIVTFFLYSTLFMKKSSRKEFYEVHRKVTNTVFLLEIYIHVFWTCFFQYIWSYKRVFWLIHYLKQFLFIHWF